MNKRGQAMAVYGTAIIVSPLIGPLLGGWITDNYSWRWICCINVPVGLATLLMIHTYVEDPPYIQRLKKVGIDYAGLGFLAIALTTLQVVLDKGQEADWLSAVWIRWFLVIASVSLIAFVVREVTATAPIVNLRVLANQNLATGTFLIGLLGIIIYGTTAILPLFLQDLIGYTPYLSGLAVAPRGIGALASMLLAGRLAGRFDERLLITIGVVIRSVSLLLLGDLNVTMSMGSVVWPNIINGFANGFLFVLLTTITMETLPREMIGMGTGLYNLFRNMGASFGISMVTTFLTRGAQAHQDMLVQHFNPSNLRYLSAVQRLSSILSVQDGMAGHQQALAWIYRSMVQQALLCSYIDDFRLLGFLSFLCIPFLVLFRNADKRGSPRARAIESD